MNWFLIIVAIVMTVMLMIGSLYVLVYFQAEEDKNTAWAPKIAVVLGLTLACCVVLLLPMDVANRSTGSGLDMEGLYQAVYMIIAIMILGVLPYLIFYYEAENPEGRNYQCWTAVKYEALTVLISLTVVVIMWVFLGKADVPLTEYVFNSTESERSSAAAHGLLSADDSCASPDACGLPADLRAGLPLVLRVSVTPVVYLMAMISFVGWFFFVLFGGIGLAAMPMDLLVGFTKRPQPIDVQEYAKQKLLLNERAQKLLQIASSLGEDAGRARDRKTQKLYRQFKQAVYFLEKDWQKVQVAYKERGGNPLKHFGFLLLGVISAILSLCWLIHIVLYIFIRQPAPASQFLNEYFMLLDNALPLLGTATYAIFAFYLLFCVLKGNLKFGLRFFLIPIHPMRVGNTMMNSFLFNVLLLLLCAVSAVQFCATAFATYARLTAVDMLFGVQVRNLIFLQYFFRHDVFIYLIVGVMAMTGLYLGVFPTDKRALDDADDDAPPM